MREVSALNPCAESGYNAIAALRCRTNRRAPNASASGQLVEVLVSSKGLRHHRHGFASFPHLQPLWR